MQLSVLATKEFDDGKADRVGTARRSRGKHAMRPIVRRRRAEQIETLERSKGQIIMRCEKPLNVGEPELEFR